HRHRDLVGLEADDGAIAPDDLVIRVSLLGRGPLFITEIAVGKGALGKDVGCEAHIVSYVSVLLGISGIYPAACEQLIQCLFHKILWDRAGMDTKSSKGREATQAAFFGRLFRGLRGFLLKL